MLRFIDNRVPKKDFARAPHADNPPQVRTILPKSRPPWVRPPESRRTLVNATQHIFCCIIYNITVMFLFDRLNGMVILHKGFHFFGLNGFRSGAVLLPLVLIGKYLLGDITNSAISYPAKIFPLSTRAVYKYYIISSITESLVLFFE